MLRKLLGSLMERRGKDITNSELASEINVSDATISNYFSYKNDLSLCHWIQAIRFLAPEREDEIILMIAKEEVENEKRLNCRLLMEYASMTRNFTLLQYLIETQRKAPKENKDWAEIYNIALAFQQRQVKSDELMFMLKNIRPKYNETKILHSILEARVLYRLKEYKPMFRITVGIDKLIDTIKDDYIRESYMARLCELFAQGYLYLRGDTKKARFYANNVLNFKLVCAKFKSHMYHLLGTSFIFENCQQSVEYFNKYRDILLSQNRKDLAEEVKNRDIAFTKVLWGQCADASETDDGLEKIHYYARQGNIDMVNELAKNNDCSGDFATCYLGIVNNDPNVILKALKSMIENGNKFFAQLPRQELANYPAYEMSANVLYELNIA